MLKLKPILLGILLETIAFLGFSGLLAILAKNFGTVNWNGYSMIMEFIAVTSVLMGAFGAARMAWEKGAIYGGVIALVFILLRVLLSMVFSGNVDLMTLIPKALILVCIGFIGGAAGIGMKKKNRY